MRHYILVLILVLRLQIAVSLVDCVRLADWASVGVVLGGLPGGEHAGSDDALGVLHGGFPWTNH
jgi:hypothetical protein